MPFASTHPPSLRSGAFWIGASVLDSSATSGRVVLLSKMQSCPHIVTRLPKQRRDSPRTIPRLHATTTASRAITPRAIASPYAWATADQHYRTNAVSHQRDPRLARIADAHADRFLSYPQAGNLSASFTDGGHTRSPSHDELATLPSGVCLTKCTNATRCRAAR